jgi:dTDP-4-amino-4,6-dideoxygalactose transaminase
VVLPGFKYNMMDIQAAIGIHQLPMLDGFIEARNTLVEQYRAKLSGIKGISLPADPAYPHLHAWHLLTILVEQRDAFIDAMKAKNIGIGMHYVAAHLFTYYKEQFGYKAGDFPHAEHVGARICSLPLFPMMTGEEMDRVVGAVQEALN